MFPGGRPLIVLGDWRNIRRRGAVPQSQSLAHGAVTSPTIQSENPIFRNMPPCYRSRGLLQLVTRRHLLRAIPVTQIRMAKLFRLLHPHRITPVDRTAADHGGIDADFDFIMLGRRTQDA